MEVTAPCAGGLGGLAGLCGPGLGTRLPWGCRLLCSGRGRRDPECRMENRAGLCRPRPPATCGTPTLGSCALPGLGPVGGGDIKFQPGRSPGSGRGVGRVRRTLQKVPVDKPVNPEAECSCVRVCVCGVHARVCVPVSIPCQESGLGLPCPSNLGTCFMEDTASPLLEAPGKQVWVLESAVFSSSCGVMPSGLRSLVWALESCCVGGRVPQPP